MPKQSAGLKTSATPQSAPGLAGGLKRELPLLAVIFLDSVSYALILPLLPAILGEFGAGALAGGMLIATHAIAAAGSGPTIGALSDRFGRRPVVLLTLIGTIVSYALFAVGHSLSALFLARALAGAMAGNISVVQAAVAEARPPSARAGGMARVAAAWALGFVAGPACGALLPLRAGHAAFWPGLLGAAASFVGLLMVLILHRPGPSWREAASKPSEARSPPPMGRKALMALFGALAAAQTGLVSVTGFWAHYSLGWGAREVSLLFLWTSAFIVAVQLVGVPRLTATLGESRALAAALAAAALACAAVVLVPKSAAVLLVAGPLSLCGITACQTLCSALISRLTSDAAQGAALGVANGVASLCRVVAPASAGALFQMVRPDSPFIAISAMLLAWLLAWMTAGRGAPVRA